MTRDIYELLLVDEMSDGRFNALDEAELAAASLFARAVRYGPFAETAPRSGVFKELPELEDTLEPYMELGKLQKETTVTAEGQDIKLSAVGTTLYYCNMSVLIYARNKFNTLLEDRTRQPKDPDKVKGLERRKQLTVFFNAVNLDQLKKGLRALEFDPPSSKPACVDTLIGYFAPKKRKRQRPEDDEAEAEAAAE